MHPTNHPYIDEFAAAWINNDDADRYNTTITVNQSTGTVPIRLYAAIGTRANGKSGNARYAREVKILPGPLTGKGRSGYEGYREPGEGDSLTTVSYMEGVPSALYAGTWKDNNTFFTSGSIPKTMNLNIDKFKRAVSPGTCADRPGDSNCYYAEIYVYRCYSLYDEPRQDPYIPGVSSIYGGFYQNSCSAVPAYIKVILPGEPKPQEDPGNTPTPIVNAAQTQCYSAGDAGPYYGNTVSKVSVTNYTTEKSDIRGYNNSGGDAVVFAKPTDKVQFAHSLCFGVQGVQGGPGTSNTFSLSTTKILGTNRTSLFNRGTTTLAQGQARPPQLSADGADPNVSQQVAYGFTLSSPHATDAQGKQVGRYEVANDDVGTAITQSLQHNVKSGFVNQRFNIGGSCSCNNNSASSTNSPIFGSYDAVKNDKTYAYWGAISNYSCSAGGKCGCSCSSGQESSCRAWNCGTQFKYNTPSRSYPTTFSSGDDAIKTASVYVPYNFTTTVNASTASQETVSAGETVWFSLSRVVNGKKNGVVDPSGPAYTTVLPGNRQVKTVSFTLPAETSHKEDALKGNNNVAPQNGETDIDLCQYFSKNFGQRLECISKNEYKDYNTDQKSYSVPNDTPIGTKVCMAIATYPSDSYNHGTINDDTTINIAMKGGSTWNISNVACTTVAKTPSFQVWNGGVYTSGNISAKTSKINDVLFGSWAEQVAIANGSISGFASGAQLGYGDGTTTPAYNFPIPTNSINRSKVPATYSSLTISNFGKLGYSDIYISSPSYVNQLRSRYSTAPSVTGDTSTSSQLNNSPNIKKGTHIIYSSSTVTIDQNICYGTCDNPSGVKLIDQNFTASSAADLPQVLIFANNINIDPSVTRVDAWLIAEDAINTCSLPDKTEVDAENCKAPLIVNGPIITKKLALNRTGGSDAAQAGIHEGSQDPRYQDLSNDGPITPAEIFNLRPDVYFWGQNQANEANNLVTTYTRELAPRY